MKTPVVFAMVPLALQFGRDIFLGMRDYLRASMYTVELQSIMDREREWEFIRGNERAIGMVGFISLEPHLKECMRLKIPIINVSSRMMDQSLRQVIPDNRVAGRMAAEHLLSRGIRSFAYCGYSDLRFAVERREGFTEAVRESGVHPMAVKVWLAEDNTPSLREWFRQLPKPVGLLASDDSVAATIARMCAAIGVRVPEDVAIVGVNNDQVQCETTAVPLTSVDIHGRRVGYEAMQQLHRLIKGEDVEREVLVAPKGVAVRESTDTVATADPLVSEALRFVRQHACAGIDVSAVAEHVAASRRTLEMRMKGVLGVTVRVAIRKAQMEQARRLLTDTDLKIPDIAERCGFSYVERFSVLFHKAEGLPPAAFRGRHRIR